jgi:hypothetical protein
MIVHTAPRRSMGSEALRTCFNCRKPLQNQHFQIKRIIKSSNQYFPTITL